jgi:hypothetical protein
MSDLDDQFWNAESAARRMDVLEQENEKLKADIALLRKVLKMHDAWHREYDDHDGYGKSEMQVATESALSATASSDAWLKEQKAKALEGWPTKEMIGAMRAFFGDATYLSHPDIPYNGTENGDTEEAWNDRLWSAGIKAMLAAAPAESDTDQATRLNG